jgi:hypothetical protein
MALSSHVRLSLGWPPRPTIRADIQGCNPDHPGLAEIIHVEIQSGHHDTITISGTPRQLHELLIELAATVRRAVPAARQAAAQATATRDLPAPGPAAKAS